MVDTPGSPFQAHLSELRQRMREACERSGRQPQDVALVVVTKTVTIQAIRLLPSLGVTDVGESRVQDALPKIEAAGGGLRWHFLGHLQSNKARKVAARFDAIHSIDSVDIGRRVAHAAREAGRSIDAFVQVNVAGEPQKSGLEPEAARAVAGELVALDGLRLVGLMTMAPLSEDPEEARPVFRKLRELFEELRESEDLGPSFCHLSMGMTDDFEVAIEEGATLIRVGRAVFQGLPDRRLLG
ncbi:MAG: YggS family pyridoxal phosphate-dependent enzyme [Planctomycetota bacterium]